MGGSRRALGNPDGDLGGHVGLVARCSEELALVARPARSVIKQVVELGRPVLPRRERAVRMGVGEQLVCAVDVLVGRGLEEIVEVIGLIGLLDPHADRVGGRLCREGTQRSQDERAQRDQSRGEARECHGAAAAPGVPDALRARARVPAAKLRAGRSRPGARPGPPIVLRMRRVRLAGSQPLQHSSSFASRRLSDGLAKARGARTITGRTCSKLAANWHAAACNLAVSAGASLPARVARPRETPKWPHGNSRVENTARRYNRISTNAGIAKW